MTPSFAVLVAEELAEHRTAGYDLGEQVSRTLVPVLAVADWVDCRWLVEQPTDGYLSPFDLCQTSAIGRIVVVPR